MIRKATSKLCPTLLALSFVTTGCGSDAGESDDSPFAKAFKPDAIVQVPGLKAKVDIVTDRLGIPHVYAKNDEDADMAIGYLHAQNRLFLMDISRHAATGKMAEYFGASLLEFDLTMRAQMMSDKGILVPDLLAQSASPETSARLGAYSQGVNLYLKELREGKHALPPGYLAPELAHLKATDIQDWTPSDSFALLRLQEFGLTPADGGLDAARFGWEEALPAEMLNDLVRFAPADPTVILPDWFPKNRAHEGSQCSLASAMRRRVSDRLQVLVRTLGKHGLRRMQENPKGSNNWVIGGQYTQSGSAIVANDPHLNFEAPASFYNIHVNTKAMGDAEDPRSKNVMGISSPGIPTVVLGHNEDVAWGGTVVGWDVGDIYLESTNEDATATLLNGQMVPMLKFPQTFKVGVGPGAKSETTEIAFVPHHGPVAGVDPKQKQAVSMKWTGRQPLHEYEALWSMERARNIAEFMDAVKGLRVLAQNWNAADRHGALGYFPHADIPVRASLQGACRPVTLMDGTGKCEWVGVIPPEQIPSKIQDRKGWLATANNDVAGNLLDNDPLNDPLYLLDHRDAGFRASRITQVVKEWISTNKRVTIQDVSALQGDVKSLLAPRVVVHLLAAAKADPGTVQELGLGDVIARLSAWDYQMASGASAQANAQEVESSISASVFAVYLSTLTQAVFFDELKALGVEIPESQLLSSLLLLLEKPDALKYPKSYWDRVDTKDLVETSGQVQLGALSAALQRLASPELFGSADPQAWRWGKIHQLVIPDPSYQHTGKALRSLGPFPRPGGAHTVDVADWGQGSLDFKFRNGPAMRFVAEMLPDGPVAVNSLPGGQSDDPNSPHYDDMLKLWLTNQTFPYFFKEKDIIENKEYYVRWTP